MANPTVGSINRKSKTIVPNSDKIAKIYLLPYKLIVNIIINNM